MIYTINKNFKYRTYDFFFKFSISMVNDIYIVTVVACIVTVVNFVAGVDVVVVGINSYLLCCFVDG